MRLALVLLALAGCAHAPTTAEVLAHIPTAGFQLRDDAGAPWALADQRGHVVLLQFCASWCAPCIAQVTELAAVSRRHPDLTLASVDMDLEADRTGAAFKETAGIRWTLLASDEATRGGQGPFGTIAALPTLVVVDAAGVVRAAFVDLVPDAQLEQAIADARHAP